MILKKYRKDNGYDRKGWSNEVHDKYSKELDELKRKNAKTSAELLFEAFNSLNINDDKIIHCTIH